jgi:hypothetical protein
MKSFVIASLLSFTIILGLGSRSSFAENAVSAESVGTAGGGGGNTLGGKLVESYNVKPSTLPGYDQYFKPILDAIKAKVPRAGGLMEYTLDSAEWYLIPGMVKPQSEQVTGLPFPSDQVAVQKQGEIWIDQDMDEALEPKEQGKLILHEVVLALLRRTDGWSDGDGSDDKSQAIMRDVRKLTNLISDNYLGSEDDLSNALQILQSHWAHYCAVDHFKLQDMTATMSSIAGDDPTSLKNRKQAFFVQMKQFYTDATSFCAQFPDKDKKKNRLLVQTFQNQLKTDLAYHVGFSSPAAGNWIDYVLSSRIGDPYQEVILNEYDVFCSDGPSTIASRVKKFMADPNVDYFDLSN